jgi:hypothetical protein
MTFSQPAVAFKGCLKLFGIAAAVSLRACFLSGICLVGHSNSAAFLNQKIRLLVTRLMVIYQRTYLIDLVRLLAVRVIRAVPGITQHTDHLEKRKQDRKDGGQVGGNR